LTFLSIRVFGVKCEYLGGQLMSAIQMISLQCLNFIEPVDHSLAV